MTTQESRPLANSSFYKCMGFSMWVCEGAIDKHENMCLHIWIHIDINLCYTYFQITIIITAGFHVEVLPFLWIHGVISLNLDQDVCFTSEFFFSEISVDHCLNYRGHALNDALGREHAALLRDTRCIWGNQEYNKVDPLTLNRLFINHHYFFILLVLSNFLFHSICHFLPSPHFPTATILLLF